MCGIIGAFNHQNAKKIVKLGLKVMANRGRDGSDIYSDKNGCLGHNLHAIVDLIKQPIKHNDCYLVANCEIYNWKELDARYGFSAKNDAEVLLRLINRKGIDKIEDVLKELDGVYAFAYYDTIHSKIILARDILGEKPLTFSFSSFLAFASERKALIKNGIFDTIDLNPRKIVVYDCIKNRIDYLEREFFSLNPVNKASYKSMKKETLTLLREAIHKRVPDKKVGLLFSGGIDSVFLAYALKRNKIDFVCYTAALKEDGMEEAEDVIYAKKAAKALGLKLKIVTVGLKQTEKYIKQIIPLIEDTNVVKVGVALPFFIACEAARKDKVKVMLSGLGSEEIFAGYERHMKSQDVNKECVSGLLKLYERDLYRDDVVTMANCMELRLPFLDIALVDYALKIPAKYKINADRKKIILRDIAEEIGIPKELAARKKKAAQYGSKFDRAIEKLMKKNGFRYKHDYLNSLSENFNSRLGVLWSGGKDSAYAAYLMKRHNYDIKCLLTIKSKNKYSYMFHTPNINMVEMQAKAMGIPIMTLETPGDKEEELSDLKQLILDAKKKHGIEGVVTGALFSTYQRDRIDKIADSCGVKIFSPLWHKDQYEQMIELLESRFKFILSSVAADGLDDKWIGREVTRDDVEKLRLMNEKIGINIAGEGGEYESFVIDCPLFVKRINLKKAHTVKEGKTNYFYVIDEAELEEK